MRKNTIAATTILGLSAFAASVLVGQQQEVQALSLGSGLEVSTGTPTPTPTASESGEGGPQPTTGPSAGPTSDLSPTPTETNSPSPTPTETSTATGAFKNGDYTSSAVKYKYGVIQLGVTVSDGSIASIDLIQATTTGRGYDKAPPILVDAALKAQGANFGNLSGATYSTQAFKKALENALAQAQN